jgi:hypothetical protein
MSQPVPQLLAPAQLGSETGFYIAVVLSLSREKEINKKKGKKKLGDRRGHPLKLSVTIATIR